MCLVLDVNSFSKVFNKSDSEHENFSPVLEWIVNGNGKLIFGGTKYHQEIMKLSSYLKIIKTLQDKRKIIRVDDVRVDKEMEKLKESCQDSDFDDAHIIALLTVSGCLIYCGCDERLYKYLKRRDWFKKGKKPKIYNPKKYKKCRQILCERNIAKICKNC